MDEVAPTPVVSLVGSSIDPYRHVIERVYSDSPSVWERAIGSELWFQFGLFPPASSRSLDDAGERYLRYQIDRAMAHLSVRGLSVSRVLDVGCGWGAPMRYILRRLPTTRVDGINISRVQLDHLRRRIRAKDAGRVRLYHGDAQDLDLIPDVAHQYHLIVMRGCVEHFSADVFRRVTAHSRARLAPGGVVLISACLRTTKRPDAEEGFLSNDLLGLAYRKSVEDVMTTLECSRLHVVEVEEVPDRRESTQWLSAVHDNISAMRDGDITPALATLKAVCADLIEAIRDDRYAVYSILATR